MACSWQLRNGLNYEASQDQDQSGSGRGRFGVGIPCEGEFGVAGLQHEAAAGEFAAVPVGSGARRWVNRWHCEYRDHLNEQV